MERDYEIPLDFPDHVEQGIQAINLALGSELSDRLMIPCPHTRRIIQHLCSRGIKGRGSGQISVQSKIELEAWLWEHRNFLSSFLILEAVPVSQRKKPPRIVKQGGKRVRTDADTHEDPDTDVASHAEMEAVEDEEIDDAEQTFWLSSKSAQLLQLWCHYASPAPEMVFMPHTLIHTVSAIVYSGRLDVQNGNKIAKWSPGLHNFLTVTRRWDLEEDVVDLTTDSTKELSMDTRRLLKKSVELSHACMRGQPTSNQSAPYTAPHAVSEFEEFMRTGTWAPHNPVIRRLPWYKREYENHLSRRRADKTKQDDTAAAIRALSEEVKRTGVTCNKYKERHSVLTPGLFTVFCLHCKMCVAFELMENTESPATAFRMFSHRAWTTQDFRQWRRWKSEKIWEDYGLFCGAESVVDHWDADRLPPDLR
eukprot:Tamp_15449.p1 GENE.Tamp_15449~~Tamp_15449.p1  ORF type:complete len:422 (-),score=23.08 Tamp_15449:110-1375(-)